MDLVALEEIRQVKYRYLRCVDLKLWDDLAEVLTPDATVDYGTMVYGQPLTLAGRDEIVAFLRDKLGPDMITVHSAGQPEITVDGDQAAGTWAFEDTVYATAHRVVIKGAAFYTDRYRRGEDGRWRIAHTGYVRTYEAMLSLDDLPSFRFTARLGTEENSADAGVRRGAGRGRGDHRRGRARRLGAGPGGGVRLPGGQHPGLAPAGLGLPAGLPVLRGLDRAVHQDGPGQPGHPVLPRLPARRRRVRGHRPAREHRGPELPGAQGRLLPGAGAGQPERVRRPGHRHRRRRHVRAALRARGGR